MVLSIPTARPAGMLQERARGTAAPFHPPPPLTPAELQREGEIKKKKKTNNLLENPGRESKPFQQAGARSIPSLMLFHFPSKVLCFIIGFLRSPSQTAIPLRGALALPPPRFVASFPVYCAGGLVFFIIFFLQQAYLLIFLTGQSNTFHTCGDLHLQDPRGSLPSLVKQEGGLGDRKMHDSFKLLLLSPSGTQVHASTQKAFLLFVSY